MNILKNKAKLKESEEIVIMHLMQEEEEEVEENLKKHNKYLKLKRNKPLLSDL